MTAEVLDLFSAAAGGWSLGMHRAGFTTIAACEVEAWRRALYSINNPGVRIYDDVRTLTADRLRDDLGRLPSVVVGSPPCQDISSANTKGKGVEGERSGLYFEAIRIIGEVRPRWFALENSANLRTRGADRVLGELEALGYACWAFVVGADDIGANHERKRSWLIGCDLEQVADAESVGHEGWRARRHGQDGDCAPRLGYAAGFGCREGRPGRRAGTVARAEQPACRNAANTNGCSIRLAELSRGPEQEAPFAGDADPAGNTPDPDQARQADGCVVAGIRQEEIADAERGAGRCPDGPGDGQMAVRPPDRADAFGSRADWSLADLARHIRLDDGLPGWVADTRLAHGGPKGTSAASLLVEAFGDAVCPQIPEAIGRAILRTERALSAVLERTAA